LRKDIQILVTLMRFKNAPDESKVKIRACFPIEDEYVYLYAVQKV
jgi:hypothetical protein